MVQGSGSGFLMNVVIGIIGALIGGFIMSLFGSIGVTGFNLWSLLVALIGSIVLLGIVNLFRKGRA